MKIKRLSIIKFHFYLDLQTEAAKKLLTKKNLFQYNLYIYIYIFTIGKLLYKLLKNHD